MSARNTPAPCYCCDPCSEDAVRAAAPYLLAALRDLIDHPGRATPCDEGCRRRIDIGAAPCCSYSTARAAIARAEGR